VGDAVVRITIQALKYFNRVHNKVGLDFDSTRPADQENPLAKLIGQNYQIKLSRRGDVLGIVEATQARSAVPASSPAFAMMQRLLSEMGSSGIIGVGIPRKEVLTGWMAKSSGMGSNFEQCTLRRSPGDGGRLAGRDKQIPAAGNRAATAATGIADNTSATMAGLCSGECDVRDTVEQRWVAGPRPSRAATRRP
jgi:hypothetical protein